MGLRLDTYGLGVLLFCLCSLHWLVWACWELPVNCYVGNFGLYSVVGFVLKFSDVSGGCRILVCYIQQGWGVNT